MMAIGYVGKWHRSKCGNERRRINHAPNAVGDAIGSCEIEYGRLRMENRRDALIDFFLSAVSQEDGTGVRGEGINQTGAVILLHLAGFFVLLDDVAAVVVDLARGDEAGLDVIAH